MPRRYHSIHHRMPSARNIAVGNKIREIRASHPGISPQQAMSMASKAVAGRGLYLQPSVGSGYHRRHKIGYY